MSAGFGLVLPTLPMGKPIINARLLGRPPGRVPRGLLKVYAQQNGASAVAVVLLISSPPRFSGSQGNPSRAADLVDELHHVVNEMHMTFRMGSHSQAGTDEP
jgi:hypothetical protein